jgi:geranylgeranyl reductase family protein
VDIAIVGAGPAGARAAWVLARQGARVTIFDASHPREKPCGGGVTGRALALVADAIDATSCARTSIHTARFVRLRAWGASAGQVRLPACGASAEQALDGTRLTRESATVDLDRGALVVASRAEFDAALLEAAQQAGAALEPARVTDVRVDADGVTLETRHGPWRADVVIGADGANSLVRRRVARPFRRDQLSIATGFFAHGVTSTEIVIAFVADPPGYIWSFPRPGHLAIGICAEATAGHSSEALRARTAEWIRATGIARGARLEPYAWPIPSLAVRDASELTVSGSRWLLAGDAAGLVDPITREGIYFALASGQWAAESLRRDGFASTYASRVAEEAGRELARAARFKAGFFRPAFINVLMRALEQSAGVRAVMADLIAGRQGYADLRWRLLKTFEIGLAWRALTSSSSRPAL